MCTIVCFFILTVLKRAGSGWFEIWYGEKEAARMEIYALYHRYAYISFMTLIYMHIGLYSVLEWYIAVVIQGNETFEKVASMGLLANFTVYLVKEFKMQQVAAANLANIFFGTTNFAPLLGAFLSDAYWGRFRTLAYSSIASFLVHIILSSYMPTCVNWRPNFIAYKPWAIIWLLQSSSAIV